MYNNNGIEIKVGQVWGFAEGDRREVLAFRDGKVVYWFSNDTDPFSTSRSCSPTDAIWKTLISDPDQPWLPLPDGYRLVTYEEMKKYKKPTPIQCRLNHDTNWSAVTSLCWCPGTAKYAVPVDHVWEEDKRPQYKLFELDWSNNYMLIKSDSNHMDGTVDGIGQRVDGYRIFGYTDEPDWIERGLDHHTLTNAYDYETQPCDHTGNRKYAIGRYEG